MTVGHTSIFYCNCQIQRADSRKGIEDCGNLFENMIIFVCLKISCFQTQPSSLFVRAKGSSEILASCMFNRREQLYCTWKSLLLSDFDQSYPRRDCNYSFGWVLPKRLQQGKRHWFISVLACNENQTKLSAKCTLVKAMRHFGIYDNNHAIPYLYTTC